MEAQCVEYFKKWKVLASRKYSLAASVMGELYYQGYGTEVDLNKSLKYFRRAAKYKFTYAQFRTGLFYLLEPDFIDHDDGIKYLKKAARRGHAESAFLLALAYGSGEYGDKDVEESDKWLALALEAKHTKAQKYAEFLYTNDKIHHDNYPKIADFIASMSSTPSTKSNSNTPASLEQRNNIQWPEDNDIEVITVSAPSVEQVFDNAIAELRNNPPASVGTTGTRIIGKTCDEILSCAKTDRDDFERLTIQLMGNNLNHMYP
ncbi:tetratricopeptide repeat protein [Litorilituus lipolyticus]|nr:tetratricopeptide repeat protein [Litorilituus lipolyticus]